MAFTPNPVPDDPDAPVDLETSNTCTCNKVEAYKYSTRDDTSFRVNCSGTQSSSDPYTIQVVVHEGAPSFDMYFYGDVVQDTNDPQSILVLGDGKIVIGPPTITE